jgi:hypothetical protein
MDGRAMGSGARDVGVKTFKSSSELVAQKLDRIIELLEQIADGQPQTDSEGHIGVHEHGFD